MSRIIPASNVREAEIVDPAHATKIDPGLELLSRLMDNAFEIPGLRLRFGLDAIIGLVPFVGDTLSSFISLYILTAAARYRVPRATLLRMAANIAVDSAVGAVPFLGDAFDVYWKSNVRNVDLLRRTLELPAPARKKARIADGMFVAGIIAGVLLLVIASITVAVLISSYILRHLSWS